MASSNLSGPPSDRRARRAEAAQREHRCILRAEAAKVIGALVSKQCCRVLRCLAKVSARREHVACWNWTQPLGTPVVPAGGMHGSSRPVSTGGAAPTAVRVLELALPEVAVRHDDALDAVRPGDGLPKVADEPRIRQWHAVSARVRSRAGRHEPMVATTTPPRLQDPEPRDSYSHGPADKHAVAGGQSMLLREQPRDASVIEVGGRSNLPLVLLTTANASGGPSATRPPRSISLDTARAGRRGTPETMRLVLNDSLRSVWDHRRRLDLDLGRSLDQALHLSILVVDPWVSSMISRHAVPSSRPNL